jgi:hypothetical protein
MGDPQKELTKRGAIAQKTAAETYAYDFFRPELRFFIHNFAFTTVV